jgi:hypothetical protein
MMPDVNMRRLLAAVLLTLSSPVSSAAVIEFERGLTNLVAEEETTQEVYDGADKLKQTRKLRSEYLLLYAQEQSSWFAFRNVFEVDGKPVPGERDRLQRLLGGPVDAVIKEARKITDEGARQNIGDIRRVIVPTLPLMFLHPLHQYRFYFEKKGEEVIDGTRAWEIVYTEHIRPTMIRTGQNDVFARGTFWIEPESGRVLQCQLTLGDMNSTLRSAVAVRYQVDERLGIWTPVEMSENYDNPRLKTANRISGRTVYTNFRRAEVKTNGGPEQSR